ncbi:hypothetical protein EMCRGX_G020110 [Ephydatia muelleri]
MNRTSPVYVHVSKSVPVHVHVKPGKKAKRTVSCGRLGATIGETGGAEESGHGSMADKRRRMRASELAKASVSEKGHWIPPPGKSSRTGMAWEGPTHRLEILAPANSGRDTVLKMSDLADDGESEVIVGGDPVEEKIGSLLSEVDELKAEVDLQKSLRTLESKESELRRSKASLREKEAQLESCRDELLHAEQENNKLKNSIKTYTAQNRVTLGSTDSQRDKLLQKLVEVEMDSHAAMRQCEALKAALAKLQRNQVSTVYMSAVTENRELLMGRLEEAQTSNKSLRKLLREEGSYQSTVKSLADQREVLLQRLAEAEATNHDMRSQLEEKEALAVHSQTLHSEIGQKNAEIESMAIRIQSLEDQLKHRDHEWVELEAKLLETQTKYSREKEAQKRYSREQKVQASKNEEVTEAMTKEIQNLKIQLEEARTKLSKASRDNIRYDAEMSLMKGKLKDLEESRNEMKRASENSANTLSSQLTEKSYEINALQLQNDRMKAKIASLEGALSGAENASISKVSALETEIGHLQSSVTTCEGLLTEYRAKLEKSHRENEELSKELRKTEQQLEHCRQDCSMEIERIKVQQQLSDMETMPELLKTTEVRLKDSHERLAVMDQQIANQTRLIAELTAKAVKAAIKLNTKKLYSADGYAVKELLKDVSAPDITSTFNELASKAGDLKMCRELASKITAKGAKLYELLGKELELREARKDALSRVLDLTEIEKGVRGSVAAVNNEIQRVNQMVENCAADEANLALKIEKKKQELERNQKRLKSLANVRPAFMEEYEKLEVELQKHYKAYMERFQNLAYLEHQLEDYTKIEQNRIEESGEALKRLQQQIHEAEKRMIHDDILGDDVGHENISKMKDINPKVIGSMTGGDGIPSDEDETGSLSSGSELEVGAENVMTKENGEAGDETEEGGLGIVQEDEEQEHDDGEEEEGRGFLGADDNESGDDF